MPPGLAIPSKSRGNVDAVAHQVAVALLDHIAQMDADAELDAPIRRKASIALDHAVLHLDGAPNGIDDASELYEDSVARPLDDAPVMKGDGRIDQIAPQRPQPRQRPLLIGASKPAVADHVRRENGCEFPGLRHDTTLDVSQSSTISWFERELRGA